MNEFQQQDGKSNKKPNTAVEILMGVGISAIAYVLIWLALSVVKSPMAVIAAIAFVILAGLGFLTVKFFRTSHTVAGVIMIILISPLILALMLLGTCSLMFLPG